MRASREFGVLQCSQVGRSFSMAVPLNGSRISLLGQVYCQVGGVFIIRRRGGKGCVRKRPESHGPRNDSWRRFISVPSLEHLLSVGQLYAVNTSFAVYFAQLILSKVVQLGEVRRGCHPFKKLFFRRVLIAFVHEVE